MTVINLKINSCDVNDSTNIIKNIFKVITAFPNWGCPTEAGRFCDKNKQTVSVTMGGIKLLDLFGNGLFTIIHKTEFNDKRKSCAIAEVSVSKE